jgi:hypothetical protein
VSRVLCGTSGNGGEHRRSFHGYPAGYAQLIDSPAFFYPVQLHMINTRSSVGRLEPRCPQDDDDLTYDDEEEDAEDDDAEALVMLLMMMMIPHPLPLKRPSTLSAGSRWRRRTRCTVVRWSARARTAWPSIMMM